MRLKVEIEKIIDVEIAIRWSSFFSSRDENRAPREIYI